MSSTAWSVKIAVLGTGAVGRTIAGALVERGHEVVLGSRTRDSERAGEWVRSTGGRGAQGTFADAAEAADVVFNCTAGAASLAALQLAAVWTVMRQERPSIRRWLAGPAASVLILLLSPPINTDVFYYAAVGLVANRTVTRVLKGAALNPWRDEPVEGSVLELEVTNVALRDVMRLADAHAARAGDSDLAFLGLETRALSHIANGAWPDFDALMARAVASAGKQPGHRLASWHALAGVCALYQGRFADAYASFDHALDGALAVGDQRAISAEEWRLFNRTGVTHLMSISGLHVTLVSGLAAWLVSFGWRWVPAAVARLPARKAAAVAAIAAALGYTLLAGFAVPAQRTFWMVSVVAAALWCGRIAAPARTTNRHDAGPSVTLPRSFRRIGES